MLRHDNTNATSSRIWPHLILLLLPLLASYILYASTATPYVKGKTEKAWKVLESFTYYVPWVDTIQYWNCILWIQRILFFLNWAEKNWTPSLENNAILMEAHIIHLYGYVIHNDLNIQWDMLSCSNERRGYLSNNSPESGPWASSFVH